jgi:Family of unknown function (DUF5947)
MSRRERGALSASEKTPTSAPEPSRLERLAARPAAPPAASPAPSQTAGLAAGAKQVAERSAPDAEPPERCELCSDDIAPVHRHLLDLDARRLLCACRACSVLFDRREAGGGRYRLVPDRVWRLDGFRLDDGDWAALRIPVDMAFFIRTGRRQTVAAFYPGPMGATESLLPLDRWSALAQANPVLRALERDVEALLVDRTRGARRAWLVPVDLCYQLVGLIRSSWKGIAGGAQVWQELEDFFARLERRARTVAADAMVEAR